MRTLTHFNSAAVLPVLAFFALRPGKGWLRRKPAVAATLEDGSDGKLGLAINGGQSSDKSESCDRPANGGPPLGLPPQPLAAASDAGGSGHLDTLLYGNRLPTGSLEGLDTLLPGSRATNSVSYATDGSPAPTQPPEQPPPNSTAVAGWPSPSLLPGPPLPPSNITRAGLEAATLPAPAAAGAVALAAAVPSQSSSRTSR